MCYCMKHLSRAPHFMQYIIRMAENWIFHLFHFLRILIGFCLKTPHTHIHAGARARCQTLCCFVVCIAIRFATLSTQWPRGPKGYIRIFMLVIKCALQFTIKRPAALTHSMNNEHFPLFGERVFHNFSIPLACFCVHMRPIRITLTPTPPMPRHAMPRFIFHSKK